MIENALSYWGHHVVLANLSHAAGGFGIAVVLQRYLRGQPFVPAWIGWVLLAFCLVTHVLAFTH